ncbi:MAG: lysine--tRNA ligase, partial [Flavobacteriaceae bacterium]
ALSEEEKVIIELLQQRDGSADLAELKAASGLSGKKWDASMKNLSKLGALSVEKTEDGLTVSLSL